MLDSAAVQALRDIKRLFDDGILTEEEYTNMKAEILTGARSPEPAAVHVGVTCDDCGMSPIRGVRFKCTVYCVAVLPDGRVVSGSYDDSLIVWCVAVLPDGRIISGSEDKSLKVWQTA
ncbi:M16 peptidase-like protein [Aureococcus anophagefferens]|nr:M16 peptidase-like protein [Aureococcus anophagefferens]